MHSRSATGRHFISSILRFCGVAISLFTCRVLANRELLSTSLKHTVTGMVSKGSKGPLSRSGAADSAPITSSRASLSARAQFAKWSASLLLVIAHLLQPGLFLCSSFVCQFLSPECTLVHSCALLCTLVGRSYNCEKMICISCIIRATILRCDYPVIYVLRFYVVSTTILASILRCDPTFAEICTLAFADVTQA